MTQKERLTELLKTPEKASFVRRAGVSLSDTPEGITADFLLANGVIAPPLTIGQKVYIIGWLRDLEEFTISEIYTIQNRDRRTFFRFMAQLGEASDIQFYDTNIGDDVFLTREEAERALKEVSE